MLHTILTLVLYESLAVAGLCLLHRARRSPEDLPSLQLVCGVFWTGPLAAVTEFAARDPAWGLFFAGIAVCVALGQFILVDRLTQLRAGGAVWAITLTVLAIVAATPALLSHRERFAVAAEPVFYAAWWLLALLVAAAGALRPRRGAERIVLAWCAMLLTVARRTCGA